MEDKETLQRIGSIIRFARKSKNLTQDQLARKAGYTKISLGNIERGKSAPSILFIVKLQEALDVDLLHEISLTLKFREIQNILNIKEEEMYLTKLSQINKLGEWLVDMKLFNILMARAIQRKKESFPSTKKEIEDFKKSYLITEEEKNKFKERLDGFIEKAFNKR